MNKLLNLIVMLLVPLQMCLAGNVKKISVTFNKNDFTLSMNSRGLLDIISNKQVASYGEDISEPGLPLISIERTAAFSMGGSNVRGILKSLVCNSLNILENAKKTFR